MATTTLNGTDIPLKISTDAGVTYKTVVCATTSKVSMSRDTKETDTKCGILSAAGSLKWTVNVDGVVNTTPTGTETSYEDLLSIMSANTATLVKIESPVAAGTDFFISGSVVMSNLDLDLPSGDFVSFSCTLSGSGTVDITP